MSRNDLTTSYASGSESDLDHHVLSEEHANQGAEGYHTHAEALATVTAIREPGHEVAYITMTTTTFRECLSFKLQLS